jgi:hypothetical protein
MTIQIHENFIELDDLNAIRNAMLDQTFNWNLIDGRFNPIKSVTTDKFVKHRSNYKFEHTFYNQLTEPSEHFPLLIPLLAKLDAVLLVNIKGDLLTSSNLHVTYSSTAELEPALAAVCKIAVFHLTTNNGYTELLDQQIASTENSIAIFDATTAYSQSGCTDEAFRLTVTVAYVPRN